MFILPYIGTIFLYACALSIIDKAITFDLLNRSFLGGTITTSSLFTTLFVAFGKFKYNFFSNIFFFFIIQLNFLYGLPNEAEQKKRKEGRKEKKCRRSTQSSRPINIAAIGASDLLRITCCIPLSPMGEVPQPDVLLCLLWVGVTWRWRDTCDSVTTNKELPHS